MPVAGFRQLEIIVDAIADQVVVVNLVPVFRVPDFVAQALRDKVCEIVFWCGFADCLEVYEGDAAV